MLPHKKPAKRGNSRSPARPPAEGVGVGDGDGEGEGEPAPEPQADPDKPEEPPQPPVSRKKSKSPRGRKKSKSPGGRKKSKSPGGRKKSKSPGGRKKSKSPGGRKKSKSPGGRKKSKSPSGRKKSKSPRGTKSKSRTEPKESPEAEPWRPRSDSQVPDYEAIHVTESLIPMRDDFLTVIEHLAQDERLKNYSSEFVRLYERVASAHQVKHELTARAEQQAAQLKEQKATIARLTRQLEEKDDSPLQSLVEELRAEVDASHLRELDSKGMIENLREEVDKFLDQMRSHETTPEENDAMVDYERLKKRIIQEKKEMAESNQQLKKHLAEMYDQQDALHRKCSTANLQVTNLSEKLQQALHDVHREMRLKEKLEEELECVAEEREEHATKETELSNAVRASERLAGSLQQAIRDQRTLAERLAKDNEALGQRLQQQRLATDKLQAELNNVRQDCRDKAVAIVHQEEAINKLRADVSRARLSVDNVFNRLGLQLQKTRQVELQRQELAVSAKAIGRELDRTQHEVEQEKREVCDLQKTKDILVSKVMRGEQSFQQATQNLLASKRQCRGLEAEVAQYANEAVKQRRLIARLEEEREMLHSDKSEQSRRVDVLTEQVAQANDQVQHLQRQLVQVEKKLQAQVNLTEATVLQRNRLEGMYEEARTVRDDLKAQTQIMNASTEQLREAISSHELEVKRLTHALANAEDDKACMARDMNALHLRARELEGVIAKQGKVEVLLRRNLAQLERERDGLQRDIRGVLNERDIIGTQLVRRNDEIQLLLAKIGVLQAMLSSGQEEYMQRLDDIRLLKLEVRKLRQEKALLQRDLVAGADLRRELYHISKDLAFEKQRRAALESELKTPMNLHRWRRLEAADPAALELIQKVNLLQKRLLQQHSVLLGKERQLQDADKLYLALRATVVKLPGPDVLIRLKKAQSALEHRARKIKSLFAELSMTEATVHDYRVDLNRAREELADFKSMFYTAKKKLDSLGHSIPRFERVTEDSLPPIDPAPRPNMRSVRLV